MSNVPSLTITATGVTVPQAVDVRAGILADDNAAFGGDLDIVTPSTPQAYQADNLTANITTANAAIAYTVSQFDPATAEGRYQDALGRIYFLQRKGATASAVQALCTGQPGVTLPAGQLARDTQGRLWVSSGAATFGSGGTVTVQFTCQTLGPQTLGIGELTQIAQTYPGWDAVTNTGAAVPGTATETRQAFEERRAASVAKNAHGSVAAIFGNVADVPGVLDVFAYDNVNDVVLPYGPTDYPIGAHSVYVAVVGGTDAAVAQAIWEKKDAGCGMTGNTTVTVSDTSSYVFPYPTYNVKFERPSALPIKFAVTIAANLNLPTNITTLVQQAVIAAFTGADGSQRERIGDAVFASKYFAPVSLVSPYVLIRSIRVGTTAPATLDSVDVGIDQSPTITASDITVTLT